LRTFGFLSCSMTPVIEGWIRTVYNENFLGKILQTVPLLTCNVDLIIVFLNSCVLRLIFYLSKKKKLIKSTIYLTANPSLPQMPRWRTELCQLQLMLTHKRLCHCLLKLFLRSPSFSAMLPGKNSLKNYAVRRQSPGQ
jgi:hypothetical protein